jgi:uncharacterized protein (UPF0335 family)
VKSGGAVSPHAGCAPPPIRYSPPPDSPKAPRDTMTDNISAEQLRLLIERIERLEEEKKGISDDIKDVYAEAKSTGFDVKTMKSIVRLRKMEKHHRDEAEMLLETYKTALGLT